MGISRNLKKYSFIVFISIFFTHAILLGSISDELINAIFAPERAHRAFKSIFYFLIYSFFPAGVYFALISLFLKRSQYIKRLISTIYLLAYFSWVLFVLIYYNYSGVIPRLGVLANPQEITSVIYHILHQFVGIKEWCIFAMMLVSLYTSVLLIQKWNIPLISSKRKKILISFLFILNLKGLVQYTVKKRWPLLFSKDEFMRSHHPMLADRNAHTFRQGFYCMLFMALLL